MYEGRQNSINQNNRENESKKGMATEQRQDSTLQSRMSFGQKLSDRLAKDLTTYFGTVYFLLFLFFVVIVWAIINLGIIDVITPFDPFPFYLLMVPFDFFAVFLSIVVLINQNRESKIADVRQQIDLEINVRAENEITKILHMVDELHKVVGISKKDDQELKEMKQKIDIEEIKDEVEAVLEEQHIIEPELGTNDIKKEKNNKDMTG
jgi:uncharacterized membrane protein